MGMPWLWLNEAAETIANRIVQAQPGQFTNAAGALEEARNELLDQANRGALEVHGKWFQIQETPRFSHEDWHLVSTSYWSPGYRSQKAEGGWVATVDIRWDGNTFNYEDDEVDGCGYYALKVRSEDIDRIWPSATVEFATAKEALAHPSSTKNPGGAPRKFRDGLLIEIIRIADLDGLPNNKSELIKRLEAFSSPDWQPDDLPSHSLIYQIATEVYKSIRSKT
jgi:hypothetical protein